MKNAFDITDQYLYPENATGTTKLRSLTFTAAVLFTVILAAAGTANANPTVLSPDEVSERSTAAQDAAVSSGLTDGPLQELPDGAPSIRIDGTTIRVDTSAGTVQISPEASAPTERATSGDSVTANYSTLHLGVEAAGTAVLGDGVDAVAWTLKLPENLEARMGPGGGLAFRHLIPGARTAVVDEFAGISAPWAVDSTGKSLPTAYVLDGDRLIQTVDRSTAVGDVVADPRISYGAGVYLNARGWELNAARGAIIAAGGIAQVGTCAFAARLPSPASGIITTACAVAGLNLINIYQAILVPGPFDPSQCYQLRIVPTGTGFNGVGNENCA